MKLHLNHKKHENCLNMPLKLLNLNTKVHDCFNHLLYKMKNSCLARTLLLLLIHRIILELILKGYLTLFGHDSTTVKSSSEMFVVQTWLSLYFLFYTFYLHDCWLYLIFDLLHLLVNYRLLLELSCRWICN